MFGNTYILELSDHLKEMPPPYTNPPHPRSVSNILCLVMKFERSDHLKLVPLKWVLLPPVAEYLYCFVFGSKIKSTVSLKVVCHLPPFPHVMWCNDFIQLSVVTIAVVVLSRTVPIVLVKRSRSMCSGSLLKVQWKKGSWKEQKWNSGLMLLLFSKVMQFLDSLKTVIFDVTQQLLFSLLVRSSVGWWLHRRIGIWSSWRN